MQTLKEYKWSLLALLCILGGLIMSRGGLAALMPLARFFVPFLVVYFIFRALKKRLMSGNIGDVLRAKMEDAMRQQQQMQGGRGAGGAGGGKVIDLCPKCGSYLSAGHRCK